MDITPRDLLPSALSVVKWDRTSRDLLPSALSVVKWDRTSRDLLPSALSVLKLDTTPCSGCLYGDVTQCFVCCEVGHNLERPVTQCFVCCEVGQNLERPVTQCFVCCEVGHNPVSRVYVWRPVTQCFVCCEVATCYPVLAAGNVSRGGMCYHTETCAATLLSLPVTAY